MTSRYISDDTIKDLVRRSTFFTVFTYLKDYRFLPPAVAAWVNEYRATRSPFIRQGMIAGLLLDTEMVTKVWPKPAKTQAMFLIDRALKEFDQRAATPMSLTIPQKDTDGQPA